MKNRYSVQGFSSVLAYVLAVAMAGCSSDESHHNADGSAGRGLAGAGVAGTTNQSLLAIGGGGVGSGGQTQVAGVGVAGDSSAVNTRGGTGAVSPPLAGAAGSDPGMAGAAGTGLDAAGAAGVPTPAAFSRITASVANPVVRALPEEDTAVTVTIHRDGSDYGVVNVSAEGLPSATAATPVAVPDLATVAQLNLIVQRSAETGGPYPFTIVASSAANPSIVARIPAKLYVTGASGARDASFGTNGAVVAKVVPQTVETSPPTDVPGDVVIDSKHRVILGGHSQASREIGWVARFGANGTLDATFDGDGKLDNFGQLGSSVYHLALSGDGLHVGVSQQVESSVGMHFIRKLADDGTSDRTFNMGLDVKVSAKIEAMEPYQGGVVVAADVPMIVSADGTILTTFSALTPSAGATHLAVDFNNHVLFARALPVEGTFEVGRLLGSGGLDPAFGTAGSTKIPCWAATHPHAHSIVALVVAPGNVTTAVANCATQGKYQDPGGSATFTLVSDGHGASGIGTAGTQVVGTTGSALSGVLQSDGKPVILLYDYPAGGGIRYQLKRYHTINKRGNLDDTFATSGVLDLTGVIPSNVSPAALAYDAAAERVVLVATDANGAIALYRFWL